MIIKGRSGTIYRQPGATYPVNRFGVMSAEETYAGDWLAILALSPAIGAAHPEIPGLLLSEKTPKKMALGLGEVSLVYKGLDPSYGQDENGNQSLPAPVVENATTTSEEPIETHPDFLTVLVVEAGGKVLDEEPAGGQTGADILPIADPSKSNCFAIFSRDGSFKGFGKDAGGGLAGVTSYLVSRLVRTTTIVGFGNIFKDENVGKIVNGWLISSVNRSVQGGVTQETQVELFHGSAGAWNTLIYQTA